MEENLSFRRRKRTEERLFTKKEVDELLKEAQKQLDVQYSVLKEVYENYERLKKEHELLKEKLSSYENPADGYRKDWTWVAKIVFVLKKSGKPLRSAEIIEILEKREEHLKEHTSKQQYFSAFINMALKAERIIREKRKGERGYYYLLPE
jgi:cell division septum initiation protein DivIVA